MNLHSRFAQFSLKCLALLIYSILKIKPNQVSQFRRKAIDKHLGGHTFGGYSTSIVVDEAFVLKVPAGLDLAATAPLLCAGITTYSPLRHWKVGPNQKVGIVGLGGLGHMGVKFARAFGAHVVLFTTSSNKIADGQRLGEALDRLLKQGVRFMAGCYFR